MYTWLKAGLVSLVERSQNEDSSILPLLFTVLPPSAVQHIPHLIDYSVHAEAVQFLLYSKNHLRNKTSQASIIGSLCARQQSSTSHLGQPASASGDFPQHSNEMSGPPEFTNNSRAEPCWNEGTCALTVLHMDTVNLCLKEKRGYLLGSHIKLQILSTVTLK